MDSFQNLLFGSRQVEGLMFYKMQKNDFDQRNTNLDQFLVLIMVLIMNLTKGFLDRSYVLVQVKVEILKPPLVSRSFSTLVVWESLMPLIRIIMNDESEID